MANATFDAILCDDAVHSANLQVPTLSANINLVLPTIAGTFLVSGYTAGGDLSGTYPNPTVTGIQGHAIVAPTVASNLRYDGANFAWDTTVYVTGPVSVVDGNLAVFNGTSGKILKDGGAVPTNPITFIKKTANTSRTSTVALANDPDLQVALSASTSYLVRFKVFFSSTDGTPNIKFALTYSGTIAAVDWYFIGNPMGNPASQYIIYSAGNGTLMTSTAVSLNLQGEGWAEIEVAVSTINAGTLALQWAQNASYPVATIVKRGSYIQWWTS